MDLAERSPIERFIDVSSFLKAAVRARSRATFGTDELRRNWTRTETVPRRTARRTIRSSWPSYRAISSGRWNRIWRKRWLTVRISMSTSNPRPDPEARLKPVMLFTARRPFGSRA